MTYSELRARNLSMASALTVVGKPAFDRSQVTMVIVMRFDEFTRLHVSMEGGYEFEIDSRTFPFNIEMAADWLAGRI